MKTKFTLLSGLFALLMPNFAHAQDLVIPTNNNSGVEILNSGRFDRTNQNIGNTSADTQVYLGEVDFGTDGNKFQATSILLANGWYVDGWAILHAGSSYESSLPFTQMRINETGGYQHYLTYGANMGYNATDSTELSGGGPAISGLTFTKPTGRQKVYLTFVGGAGNIRNITFHQHPYLPTDFVQDTTAYDTGFRILDPNEKPDYEQISRRLLSVNSVPAVSTGEGTDYPETRIDTTNQADGHMLQWGWTKEGFIADFGEMDFGNGEYNQLVNYFTHYAENIYDYTEIYIDAVETSNLIANFWTGLDLGNHGPYPYAKNIKKITGRHRLLCKWRGGSTNVGALEIVQGTPWQETIDCGIVLEDVEPSADAFHFTFTGCPEGQGNPWAYEVKCKGQYESKGNIGYTKNGTVIDFFMPDGTVIDFGDNLYKSIIVNHSCDKSWVGEINEANFSFYLDLDPDYSYTPEDWDGNLASILEGHEPIAIVRLQGTGAWTVTKRTAGDITTLLSGKHELFMVYNTPDSSTGANVFDIYLDPRSHSDIRGDVNGDKIVNVSDVTALINTILGEASYSESVCDINGDGNLNVSDVTQLINLILGN